MAPFSPQSGPPAYRITILGREYAVPDDKLIWIFQDLGMIRHASKFCWNGDCKNCVVSFKPTPDGEEISERACQTAVLQGMSITRMPKEFYLVKIS